MDDEVPAEAGRSLIGKGNDYYETPTGRVEKWSCVDYVDTIHEGGRRATRSRTAEKPDADGLQKRFGELDGHDRKNGDEKGECTETIPVLPRGDTYTWTISCNNLGGSRGQEVGPPGTHRWYKGKQTNRGWPGTAEGKINTAQGMAGDLVGNLNNDEKGTVAQILTKNVSGAEVVEIRAVTTTSVLTNVCYDLRYKKTLTPFGCAGFGANLISVTDGHVAARLAYKLKAGLSYNVTPRVTAFVSGYYHQVLGDGEYYDIPLQHLRDDRSPEGRSNNYALAKFEMAYVGAEIGMRFAFK